MTLFFRPHGSILKAPVSRGPADVALVAFLEEALGSPIARDAGVDFEDWIEPAVMLEALLAMGLEVAVLHPECRLDALVVTHHVRGRVVAPNVLIGRLSVAQEVFLARHPEAFAWPRMDQAARANRYASLAAFQAHAGRRCVLADMPGEPVDPANARDPLDALVSFQGQPVVVKQVWPPKAFPVRQAEVPAACTRDDADRFFSKHFGYHLMRFEGDPEALLLQEPVAMGFETRLFVVDGKVVAGAGCVEAHTPLDCSDTPVDPVLESKRNAAPALPAPEVRDLLLAFGQQVAAEMASEGLLHHTLDVALGPNGPLVVECNPIHNSGLYALPVGFLMEAILAAAGDAPAAPLAFATPDTVAQDGHEEAYCD